MSTKPTLIFVLAATTLFAGHDEDKKRKAASDLKPPEGLTLAADPGAPAREGTDIKEVKDRYAHWEKRFDTLKTEYAKLKEDAKTSKEKADELAKRRITMDSVRPFQLTAMKCYRNYRAAPDAPKVFQDDTIRIANPDEEFGYLVMETGYDGKAFSKIERLGVGMSRGYPPYAPSGRDRRVHGASFNVPRTASLEDSNEFGGVAAGNLANAELEFRARDSWRRDVTVETYLTEKGDLVVKFDEKAAPQGHQHRLLTTIYCVGYKPEPDNVTVAREYERDLLDRFSKADKLTEPKRKLLTERVFPALRYLFHGNADQQKKAREYLQDLMETSDGPLVYDAIQEYGKSTIHPGDLAQRGNSHLNDKDQEKVLEVLSNVSPDFKTFASEAYQELINAPWLVARAKLLDDIASQMRKDGKELRGLIDAFRASLPLDQYRKAEQAIFDYHRRMLKDAGFEIVNFTDGLATVKKKDIEIVIKLRNDSVELVKDWRGEAEMEIDLSSLFGKRKKDGKIVTDEHLKRVQLSRFPGGKAIFTTRLSGFKVDSALSRYSQISAQINDFNYYSDLKQFFLKNLPANRLDIHEQIPSRKYETHQLLEGDVRNITVKPHDE